MLCFLVSFSLSALIAPHEEKSFLLWMRQSNQFYTCEEYHFRLGIFLANSRFVREINSAKKTFRLGLNKFACYTPAEYKSLLGHISFPSLQRDQIIMNFKDDVPDTVDWREKGIVNEIKDQGNCGACWAFGTIQACESAYALANGKLNSCSEQNLIDCCTPMCSGCNGGFESRALDFILQKQNGLLNSENEYPYEAAEGTCRFDESKGINQIKSYIHGRQGDEDYLKTLSAQGVLDIAIDCSQASFQLYTGGIYDEPSCYKFAVNHAVGLIGYGTENGIDYWLVRNTFGKNWGEDGYIRMIRNKENRCGVATDPLLVYA